MTDRVVIPSAHVNATGLVLSLRAIGFEGPITCLQYKVGQKTIASRVAELCDVRPVAMQGPDDLPERLANWYPDESIRVLFTDERFLEAFAGDPRFETVSGAGDHLETVIRKNQFYDFVAANRLGSVPLTTGSDISPWSEFGDCFRSRVWSTWRGLERLPRGGLIQDARGLLDWRRVVEERELGDDEWGYQEQLSPLPEHNVSVCGWHDADTHQSIVTRRRGVAHGVGWWVERIDDPDNLIKTARGILDALEFVGPFELEFVWDDAELLFKVIELNPRYWMQHRLMQVLTDHALVRRSMGLPASDTIDLDGPVTWLHPDVALTKPLTSIQNAYRSVLAYPATGALTALIRRTLGD